MRRNLYKILFLPETHFYVIIYIYLAEINLKSVSQWNKYAVLLDIFYFIFFLIIKPWKIGESESAVWNME